MTGLRSARFFFAGFFCLPPVPHHRDFYPYMRGKAALFWLIVFGIIGLIFASGYLTATARAAETDLPAGYSCADVRAAVEKYGRAKMIRLAKRNGATPEQIAAAEKCL